MRGNLWKKILLFFVTLVFLTGLLIATFPYIYGALIDHEINMDALSFLETQDGVNSTSGPLESTIPEESLPEQVADAPKYPELRAAMEAYNEAIFEQGQSGLSCEYNYQKPSFLLSDYGLSSEIFGVISIPAMDLEMPIYLGATNQHMADGAAHMSQTSLPIGGSNTNCVIAGHRGYSGASYFRYIEKLQVDDYVSVTNLWETLCYRVAEIKIIDPYDVEEILIQEGRELLTLLTCHPYASGGRQRYVVYCERVNEG